MQKNFEKDDHSVVSNESGQTFVEFIFLLVMLIGLSLSLLKGTNSFLAQRWETAIKSVVRNHPGDIRSDLKLTQ